MALTTQEIMQIAKAIADKVVLGTPCACGYATWNANQNLEWARAAINSKDEKMLQAHLSSFRGTLDDVEAFCGLDMEAARNGVVLIEREVSAKAWDAAWGQHTVVSNDLSSRLREARDKELAESSSKANPKVPVGIGEQVEFEWDVGIPGEPITKASGEVLRIENGLLYVKIKESSTPLFTIGSQYIIPESYVVGKEKMPRVDPHATAIQQDKQLVEQMKWLKAHDFKSSRDAQEAGY